MTECASDNSDRNAKFGMTGRGQHHLAQRPKWTGPAPLRKGSDTQNVWKHTVNVTGGPRRRPTSSEGLN